MTSSTEHLYSKLGQRVSQGHSNKPFVDEVMRKDFSASEFLGSALDEHRQSELLAATAAADLYQKTLRDESYVRESDLGEYWFDHDSAQSDAQLFVLQSRELFNYDNRIHLLVEDLIEAILLLGKPNSLGMVCDIVEVWQKYETEYETASPWLEIFKRAGLDPKAL